MNRPLILDSFLDQASASREHEDDVNHLVGPQILLKEAEQHNICRVILIESNSVGDCYFMTPQGTLALDIIGYKNSSICAEPHNSSSPS